MEKHKKTKAGLGTAAADTLCGLPASHTAVPGFYGFYSQDCSASSLLRPILQGSSNGPDSEAPKLIPAWAWPATVLVTWASGQ